MLTSLSKGKAAVAVAVTTTLLQAAAAETDLSTASFSGKTGAPAGPPALTEGHRATVLGLKEFVRSERASFAGKRLPFSARALGALEELDGALDRDSDTDTKNALIRYFQARTSVNLAVRGMMFASIFAPIAGLTYFGFLNPRLLRREIQDRIIDGTRAFDLQDREYLEGRLASARSTPEVLNASLDILGYAWVRSGANAAPLITAKYRLFALTGGVCAMWTGLGMGCLTGSFWAAAGVAAASTGCFLWGASKLMRPLDSRGSKVAAEYREWRRAQN